MKLFVLTLSSNFNELVIHVFPQIWNLHTIFNGRYPLSEVAIFRVFCHNYAPRKLVTISYTSGKRRKL